MIILGLAALFLAQATVAGGDVAAASKPDDPKDAYQRCITGQAAQGPRGGDPATGARAVLAACSKQYDGWIDSVSADQSPRMRDAAKSVGAQLGEPIAELMIGASDPRAAAAAATSSLNPTGRAYRVCMTENAHWMPARQDRSSQVQQLSEACDAQYNAFINSTLSGQGSDVRALGQSIAAPLHASFSNIVLGPEANAGAANSSDTKPNTVDPSSGVVTTYVPVLASDVRSSRRPVVHEFTIVRSDCSGGLFCPTDPTALSCGA
jgi:hypothetical protein